MNEWLDLDELLDQGNNLLEVGLHDEALALLDRHGDRFPGEIEVELLYAHIHNERNQPERALPHLLRGRQLADDNVDCLLGLFYTCAQLDKMDLALECLARAEKIAPDTEAVVGSKLWHLNSENRFGDAVAYFEKNRHIRFENPETLRNAGCAYQRLRRHPEAEACFRAALEINPFFHEARDLLADSYLMNGEGGKAVAMYREFLKRAPNHVRTLSRLVYTLSQNEEHDEALKVAQTSIAAYPNSPVGHVDFAYALLNQNDLQGALASARRALDLAPLDAEAHGVAGIVCSETGDDEAAERHFSQAIALDPDNSEIKRDYYHHLRNVGETDRMRGVVEEVIREEHPFCTEDWWFLAEHSRDEGRDLESLHCLHQAYRLAPDEPELIPPMVDIMLDRGKLAAATRLINHYVRQKGWNESMEQVARHRRLRGARGQEGLRLLRYLGLKTPDFRRYLFAHQVLHFARWCAAVVGAGCLVESAILFGLRGAAFSSALACGAVLGWFAFRFVRQRFFPPRPVES